LACMPVSTLPERNLSLGRCSLLIRVTNDFNYFDFNEKGVTDMINTKEKKLTIRKRIYPRLLQP
jgi:hypothetical protein